MPRFNCFHAGGAFAAVALSAGLLAAFPAQAVLNSTVSVSLLAPGGVVGNPIPITAVDVVSPGVGNEIEAGDATNIGSNNMLPGELINFQGDSILVHVAAGAENGSGQSITGLLGLGLQHAMYRFDNLAPAGQQITGITLGTGDGFTFAGFSGVASPASPGSYIRLASPTSITFDLDTLIFKDRGLALGQSYDFAEFRIDLTLASAVPEPAQASLFAAGLLVLWAGRRRRAR